VRCHRGPARATGVVAAVLACAILMAACTSGGAGTSKGSGATGLPKGVSLAKGGLATWAEPPMSAPNFIFPINSCCFSRVNRVDFQYLMYRPLYWFGTGGQLTLNTGLSLAYPPVYEDGDTVAVVNMKTNYVWSDGEPVDASDVVFFMNMLQAVKSADWGAYVPGYFPDNVNSVTATGRYQVTFHLTSAFNPTWFTYNELSQVTPLPLAWDISKKGGAPQSGGCSSQPFTSVLTTIGPNGATVPTSAAGTDCLSVFTYLGDPHVGLAADPANYGTTALWGIVDGPWKLKSLDTATGDVIFVPNPTYAGPVKPSLAEFEELGWPSDTAEYQALASGSTIDVGYVPAEDLPSNTGSPLQPGPNAPALGGKYTLDPVYDFAVDYLPLNFANPQMGPVFRQLYVRQALQSLIDQEAYIKSFDAGYGVPTYGPVPTIPPTYASQKQLKNPYPYSPSTAKQLLTSHGWAHVGPDQVATCVNAGSGPTQCGPGVAARTMLQFTMLYSTGITAFTEQVQAMVASWASVGIKVSLEGEQIKSVVRTAGINCFVSGDCAWAAAVDWAGGWVFAPDYLPTGEEIFDGVPLGTSLPEPVLTPISADFVQALFHTVYTENASGSGLTYKWSVSIPLDPECAAGFMPGSPRLDQATWYHADVSIGGPCNHSGRDYGLLGHPGTVTVVVSNAQWSCTATIYGTITETGAPPQPCVSDVTRVCSPSYLAVSNSGGYCDATNDANILATTESSSLSVLYTYENYLSTQLPVLFQPLPASSLTEITSHLYGVLPQNVFGDLTPEYWEWQSGYVPAT
jgi:peptide/nickel transport system substrate-binding protein